MFVNLGSNFEKINQGCRSTRIRIFWDPNQHFQNAKMQNRIPKHKINAQFKLFPHNNLHLLVITGRVIVIKSRSIRIYIRGRIRILIFLRDRIRLAFSFKGRNWIRNADWHAPQSLRSTSMTTLKVLFPSSAIRGMSWKGEMGPSASLMKT